MAGFEVSTYGRFWVSTEAYEDLGAFLKFLRSEVKLSEQEYLASVIEVLFKSTDPLTVGAARRASDLASEVGERLLSTHLKGTDGKEKARHIAQNLNKSFFAHSDAISRARAGDIGLQVAASDPKLEHLMWAAYLHIEEFMDLRRPFNALQLFLNDEQGAASLVPPAPLQLPANTPEIAMNAAWQTVLNNALQRAAGAGYQVPFTVVNAIIESVRHSTHYLTTGNISAFRLPTGEIRMSVTESDTGWRPITAID